jgi:prepilin-type N-terminal cleavage/methylation domain-containing protein
VISRETWHPGRGKPAFSLIEMVAVIAVLVILMTAGISLMNGTGSQARKAGTDLLTGMIEQARTSAITSRSFVVLAIAEPGDLPAGDERCRLGLFKVESWPQNPSDPVNGVLMSRWRTLETGIALIGGQVDGVDNPLDAAEINISYGTTKPLNVKVHAIAFNSRGGLHHPAGSTPVAMRIAEGSYRNGKATPYRRGENAAITENRMRIGRVTARPYRIDG